MIRGYLWTLNRLPEWEIYKSMSHPGILFICGLRVGFFRDNRDNRDSRDTEKLEITETQRHRDNRDAETTETQRQQRKMIPDFVVVSLVSLVPFVSLFQRPRHNPTDQLTL